MKVIREWETPLPEDSILQEQLHGHSKPAMAIVDWLITKSERYKQLSAAAINPYTRAAVMALDNAAQTVHDITKKAND